MRGLQLLILFISFQVTTSWASGPNLIFITIDGVRWQEAVGNPDPNLLANDHKPVMPFLRQTLLPQGVFLGNRRVGSGMKVANSPSISFPAYLNIFSGMTNTYRTNYFPSWSEQETFLQRIKRELALPKKDVAVFASWETIKYAVENQEGDLLMSAGRAPLPRDLEEDYSYIYHAQEENVPEWSDARLDVYTWEMGLKYLEKNRPRVLYLSFLDPDEWAHEENYDNYIRSLRFHDRKLKQLFDKLGSEQLKEYGKNTTVIITTDHGRGNAHQWTDHFYTTGADDVWLFAIGPHIPKIGDLRANKVYTHLDIRPTIEYLMGLSPNTEEEFPGVIMAQLFQRPIEGGLVNRQGN